MEAAPLTKAHAYARSAVLHTHSWDISSAVGEHAQAAGEFAQAARGSADSEALRTLQLLEQHHQKLSQILKVRNAHANPPETPPRSPPDEANTDTLVSPPPKPSSTKAQRPSSPSQSVNQPPTLPPSHRNPTRDLTSSIASNLASARGIPSGQRRRGTPALPAISAHHAGGNIVNAPSRLRNTDSSAAGNHQADVTGRTGVNRMKGHVDPMLSRADAAGQVAAARNTDPQTEKSKSGQGKSEDSFQRFYSTFEGLLSKLSAPLAFAGLPLGTEEPPATSSKTPSTEKEEQHDRVTAEPDLKNIFSKAALRAVRDGNEHSGFGAGGDSFYVVPSTGGTISYAGILSRAEQERRDGVRGSSERDSGSFQDEAEFVDARETPQQASPDMNRDAMMSRAYAAAQLPPGVSRKTMEELQLENQALKQLSDTLSRRLHMWEVNAQSSSMALQQSIRAMQQSPPVSDAGRSPADDTPDKLKELQDQLQRAVKETERYGRENEKLKAVVGRYREKWEKLKEGARMRREGGKADDAPGAGRDEA
ncbi:MAG: hypothetical protein M1825_002011 [Sarcosagium campestre]|nr:MAG: hypothetical protein M1825_002011 [Sarcosagium campestre]